MEYHELTTLSRNVNRLKDLYDIRHTERGYVLFLENDISYPLFYENGYFFTILYDKVEIRHFCFEELLTFLIERKPCGRNTGSTQKEKEEETKLPYLDPIEIKQAASEVIPHSPEVSLPELLNSAAVALFVNQEYDTPRALKIQSALIRFKTYGLLNP